MRIINQDRTMSFEFSKIDLVVQDTVIYAKQGNNSSPLGMYDSEARCKEIFNDIHNAYAPVNIVSTNLTEEQIVQFSESINVPIRCIEMNVPEPSITIFDERNYQMPEV